MMRFVGLDVSQKTTAVCVVDGERRSRLARAMPFNARPDRYASSASMPAHMPG